MSLAMIIILPMITAIGFLYWATQLDEDHAILKLAFQILFFPLIFLSIHFAVIDATILYGANTDLVEQLAMFAEYTGYVFFFFGAYLSWNLLTRIYEMFIAKKKAKEEEMYG